MSPRPDWKEYTNPGLLKRKLERDARIVTLYKSGRYTLDVLGKRYGISKERVRQVVQRHDRRAKLYGSD